MKEGRRSTTQGGWANQRAVPSFTDEPLVPGVTVANAAELRQVVDVLRTQYGLPGVAWTDPVLEVGVTPIKAIHLAELRTALDAVHVAAARTPPTYAVPALTT